MTNPYLNRMSTTQTYHRTKSGITAYYRLVGLEGISTSMFWLKHESARYVRRSQRTRDHATARNCIAHRPGQVFWRNMIKPRQTESADVCRALRRSALPGWPATLGQVDHSAHRGPWGCRALAGREGCAYHLGDRVLIDGAEVDLNGNSDRVWLAGRGAMDLGSPARIDKAKDIARAVLLYRWASQDDGRRFLGWIVAAMVGGALEWRPHLWLTAPAGTGKTWLFDNVLLKLMGSAMMPLGGSHPGRRGKVYREFKPAHRDRRGGALPRMGNGAAADSQGGQQRRRGTGAGGCPRRRQRIAQPLQRHSVQHHRARTSPRQTPRGSRRWGCPPKACRTGLR